MSISEIKDFIKDIDILRNFCSATVNEKIDEKDGIDHNDL